MNMPQDFKKPPVTLGDWIISVLVSKIPLIGFIMLIVWAVDKNTETNKANWAKAELIVSLIGYGFVILLIAIIGIGFFTQFSDQVDWSNFD